MKNLKPSQLPEGTVIDDAKQGEYIKRVGGIWEELDRDYMGTRERVSDQGYERYSDMPRNLDLTWTDKSDDYFTEYNVIASEPSFRFSDIGLHGKFVMEAGTFLDGTPMHNCKGYNCEVDIDVSAVHNNDLIGKFMKGQGEIKTDAELHALGAHPRYQYAITSGQRKSWDDVDTPPAEDHGWERNVNMGRDGWDRFDYHEESYWMRKKQ